MKVYFNRFEAEVRKGRADCYLIVGEEPWQRIAACDMVRAHARELGCVREMFFAGAGFDPGSLSRAANSGNLFGGERSLLDLRVDGAVSAALAEVIKNYNNSPPPGVILMIQAAKVDARNAWVKRIVERDEAVMVTTYNKTGDEFKTWLKGRIQAAGLNLEPAAEELLTLRADGNLPAAENALEKISLSHDAGELLSAEVISTTIGDSSRFSVYDLADAAVVGDLDTAVRVLYSLRADNAPLPLALWAVTHKLRLLAEGSTQGPPNARKVLQRALKRQVSWHRLLHRCAAVDHTVKNSDVRTGWEAMLRLVSQVCGVRV